MEIAWDNNKGDKIYKPNQTNPKQQINVVDPFRLLFRNHHEEKSFNFKMMKQLITNDCHDKETRLVANFSTKEKLSL